MNLKFLVFICILICQINLLGQSGFKGGIALSSYYTSGNSPFRDVFTGPEIGYFSDWKINKDSIRNYFFTYGFESNFYIISANVNHIKEINETYPITYSDVGLRALSYVLEIPFIFKYHYHIFDETQFHISAGFSSTINFGSTFENRYFPIYLSSNLFAGIGISYKNVILDLRYIRGLTEISPDAFFQTVSICIGYSLFD